jgi:hypothetical protein
LPPRPFSKNFKEKNKEQILIESKIFCRIWSSWREGAGREPSFKEGSLSAKIEKKVFPPHPF